MSVQRRGDAGFTLIESLVAMAVLAVGAVALLAAAERHVVQTRGLGDRVLARWAAENEIVARQLGLPSRPEWHTMLGRLIEVAAESAALADSGLVELRVAAGPPGERLVTLRAYLPDRGTP